MPHLFTGAPHPVWSPSLTMQLTPVTLSTLSSAPFTSGNPHTVVCASVLVSFVCCFLFYIPRVSEIIWFLFFASWLISLSMMLSRSSMLSQITVFLFFMPEWCSIVYMHHLFFIQSFTGWHLRGFCVLATMDNAAVHIGVCVSLWINAFSLVGSGG